MAGAHVRADAAATGGSSGRPATASSGMVSASATPASVACTPDFSTSTHSTAPSTR